MTQPEPRHRHRHRADAEPVTRQSRDEGPSRSPTVRVRSDSGRPLGSNHVTTGEIPIKPRTGGESHPTTIVAAPAHREDTPKPKKRSPARRRLRFVTLSLLFVLALCAGSVIGETREARADESARQSNSIAREFLRARADLASTVIVAAATHLESARATLESGEAQLLTDDQRRNFELTVSAADAVLRDARLQVAEATRQASAEVPATATTDQITTATAKLADWDFVTATEIDALHRSLTDAAATVTVAVERWQEEQNRLAAERAAQELAAQQAAAQARAEADAAQARAEAEAAAQAQAAAAAQQQEEAQASAAAEAEAAASSPPVASTTPTAPVAQAPAGHTEHVWATGFQRELDACKGSVDMTPSFGIAVIGEHWSCGGRAFPTTEGTIVTLTGVLSGTYRVGPVVAVLNQRTNTTSDVPGGYDLLYQTCVGGDNSRMSFTALQRIG